MGVLSGLAVIQPERQKFGNGPVGVRGFPGPQMRGTRGTHLQWHDLLPWDLGHFLGTWAARPLLSHRIRGFTTRYTTSVSKFTST